jgi:hypothetical protein
MRAMGTAIFKRKEALPEAADFLFGQQGDFTSVTVGFGVVAEFVADHDGAA